MDEKENNEYEVVAGDGSNLNISPVYEHLNAGKPRNTDEKKNIVIPKTTKNKNNENEDEDEEDKDDNKDKNSK